MKPGYSILHRATIRLLLIVTGIISLRAAQTQQTATGEANTIFKQLQSSVADTQRVKMLLALSTIYFDKTLNPVNDLDSAMVLAGEALDLS